MLEARKMLSFKTLACKPQNNKLIFLFEILFYYTIFEILNWKIWKIGKYFREKLQQKKTLVVNAIEVLQAIDESNLAWRGSYELTLSMLF